MVYGIWIRWVERKSDTGRLVMFDEGAREIEIHDVSSRSVLKVLCLTSHYLLGRYNCSICWTFGTHANPWHPTPRLWRKGCDSIRSLLEGMDIDSRKNTSKACFVLSHEGGSGAFQIAVYQAIIPYKLSCEVWRRPRFWFILNPGVALTNINDTIHERIPNRTSRRAFLCRSS
jgi:hypothetical protein